MHQQQSSPLDRLPSPKGPMGSAGLPRMPPNQYPGTHAHQPSYPMSPGRPSAYGSGNPYSPNPNLNPNHPNHPSNQGGNPNMNPNAQPREQLLPSSPRREESLAGSGEIGPSSPRLANGTLSDSK